ncbi:hypothetical protein QQY66_48580 [Streptomyces sp. DG2A-72]|uniref:nSTAND1 domain-containing NTPase n=1 Tax=Streptomyces sp. DG2A-72 TaxID=3051386 RepID=UPI00265BAFE5|nr:hypothetical protein [Streptomyces sp. DG2A-72]MDO0939178.1 hypothetical protein [Streptomyces sp. DG2A-72]
MSEAGREHRPRVGRPQRPVDPSSGPVAKLAWGLRELRALAGSPAYRVLAKKAHYAASTLADAAKGDRLPTLEVTLAYVRACGGDAGEWEARWLAAAQALNRDVPEQAPEETADERPPCPYPGLAAYTERDAEVFFGRRGLVEQTVLAVERPGQTSLTAVFGASGSGKSSLIHAGVLPVLRPRLRHYRLTPGARPLSELARAAVHLTHAAAGPAEDERDEHADRAPVADSPADRPDTTGREAGRSRDEAVQSLASRLSEDPAALCAELSIRPAGHGSQDDGLLLVIDQFVEVFTLCPDAAERDAFLTAVAALGGVPDDGIRVLLAVRADFYAHCCAHPSLAGVLRESRQLPIAAPSGAELREIVTGPATHLGVTVDPDLVGTLLAEADGRPGSLPLLSHVLRQTWLRGSGPALRAPDYQASGGLRGAVAQSAEAVYTSADEREREVLRTVFLRLTALGEGTEDTRRRISRAELAGLADPGTVGRLLDTLAAARLVTLGEHGADSVEVSHEAVIGAWPRLRGWLADDREDLLTHRRLTEAAISWDEFDHDRELLYRGGRLAAAQSWTQRHGSSMNDLERTFLAASSVGDRRRTRRSRQVTGGMAVLLVLALVAAVVAVRAERSANDQRDRALSEKVAEEAADLRRVDPALAAQLSLAAYRLSPTLAARGALLSSFAAPMATRLRHEVNTVAFSPDGRRMATGGDDRKIRIWDVTRPPKVIATAPGDQPEDVESLAYSADGRILVSGAYDGSVRIWDVAAGDTLELLIGLPAHREAVFRVVLSPDGRTLATASADGTAGLWDVSRPRSARRLALLTGHTATVGAVAFAPDGRTLATASDDGRTALWDVADSRRPRRVAWLPTREGAVSGVAFSPDGRTLAAAGADHQVQLWDVFDRAEPAARTPLTGHTAPFLAVAFSPDGRTVATGGWDQAVRLWDLSDRRRPRPLEQLANHTNNIWSLTFSPDGRTLASASSDHTVALTDVPGAVLGGHGEALSTAAVSPDGRLAIVGSEDYTARLWNIHGPDRRPVPMATLTGHTGQVKAVAFSRDGRTAATGNIDTTVGLWDVTSPTRPMRVASVRTGADVRTVSLSPDGHLIATAGGGVPRIRLWDASDPRRPRAAGVLEEDAGSISVAFSPHGGVLAVTTLNDVHLWDVRRPSKPRRLGTVAGHTDTVQAVAFASDGRTLATAGLDGTARLWDVGDSGRPRALAMLTGHVGGVQGVTFAPGGRTLATAGQDGTARLWDVSDLRHPRADAVLTGHTGQVYAVAFAPHDGTLLTSSEDRTARLWPTRLQPTAARICVLAHPRITRAEWRRYFPAIAYDPPCPTDR